MGFGIDLCLGEINVFESICVYFSIDFYEGEIWEILEVFVFLLRFIYFGISFYGFFLIYIEK